MRLLILVAAFVAASVSMVATDNEPAFWSSQETADFLGVPLSTIRYWQWQRIGPKSYRIGRARKFKPADVRAWAERQADNPEPAAS